MIKTVLFDLDDTLLGNSMDTFLPRYFNLLAKFAAKELGDDDFLPHVLKASQAMVNNTDPELTNNEVFWQEMNALTGIKQDEAEPIFNKFYLGEFNQLQEITQTLPAAADLVQTCIESDYKVVIATNPMFPRTAVEARLNWAGIPVTEFSCHLVTTIENMHATKPHREYYREILAELDCAPQEALMVGDDWRRDIEPAASLGIFTYWIKLPGAVLPDPTIPTGYGTLDDLLAQIQSGWIESLSVSD